MKIFSKIERRNFLKTGLIVGLGGVLVLECFSCEVLKKSTLKLKAGAATINITPAMNVPLDGTIMQIGPAKDVHDQLYVRCLVLDDGETKLAIAIVDNTMISGEILNQAKRLIKQHSGIPETNVLIAATHSHSTPRAIIGLKPDSDAHKNYLEYLTVRTSEGVRAAFANLQPAKIGWGKEDDPRFVFNRRWKLKEDAHVQDPFGGTSDRIAMNPSRSIIERPAGPVDPEVFVLAIQHIDGRPLGLLANYGLHYVGGIPPGTISADYFGVFAAEISKLLGAIDQNPPFVGIMSNGTSGDVNANDLSTPPVNFKPYERMKLIGENLAQTAKSIYDQLDWRERISLGSANTTLRLGVRKPDENRLKWAKSILESSGAGSVISRKQIYAKEALALNEYPDSVDIPLQVIRIGDLAIVAIPNEVFAETGLSIKSLSPFTNTFVVELANAYHGYLPSAVQHEGGGYETWPARSSYLEIEAEAKILDTVLNLLESLKNDLVTETSYFSFDTSFL